MKKAVRIILVDDHDIVRLGLKSFLDTQEGVKVIGEARDGVEAIATALALHPDVIVMDIEMPGMDGLEATRQLKSQCPDSPVVALTVHEEKQYFFDMLAAGAAGYVSKQAAADELVAAIRAVAAGHVYLQPALAHWLLDDYRRLQAKGGEWDPSGKANGATVTLSKREQEVLEWVARGYTTPQISEHLGISPKTVARHRERIMGKLNLHSSTDLVKYAIRMGLIVV